MTESGSGSPKCINPLISLNVEVRSPQSSSPSNPLFNTPVTSGQQIKEISKEIDDLRKENFNLKMRIYFMEEKIANVGGLEHLKNIKIDAQARVDADNLKLQIQNFQNKLDEKDRLLNKNQQTIHDKEKKLTEVEKVVQNLRTQIVILTQKIQSKKEIFSVNDLENNLAAATQSFGLDEAETSVSKLPLDIGFSAEAECVELTRGIEKLQNHLEAKFQEIQDAMKKINNLEKDNEELKVTSMKKSKAIQALIYKFKKSSPDKQDELFKGDELSDIMLNLKHAAESGIINKVMSSIDALKCHLSLVLSKPVNEIFNDGPRASLLQSTYTVSKYDSKNFYSEVTTEMALLQQK